MSQSGVHQFLNNLKKTDTYKDKAYMLLSVLLSHEQKQVSLKKDDMILLAAFAFSEVDALIDLIPKTKDYKLLDEIISYEDKLMGLLMLLKDNKLEITRENVVRIETLLKTVENARELESSLEKLFAGQDDDVFKLDKIEKKHIVGVLEVFRSQTSEYQKGKLYSGLLFFKEKFGMLTAEAKETLTIYIYKELERYLKNADSLTDDQINNLEIAADVCKHFLSDKIIGLLKEIALLKYSNIKFYTVETLLEAKQAIEPNIFAELAADLSYADLTHSLLQKYGLLDLFPKEYIESKYLAKSNMVRWLIYPTELGKVPDAIELLGEIKSGKRRHYIFKFKSDSDTLTDDLKNVWLVGWVSATGGTFSHFDKLSGFEGKNLKKTLKNIKKLQIG